MKPETVVVQAQRITKKSHEAIKREADKLMVTNSVIIRKILNDWAVKGKRIVSEKSC